MASPHVDTPIADPALSVLDRALRGDEDALAFLDRTLSVYVLDATDPSKPQTYGSWNFIHEVMNEVERYESRSDYSRVTLDRHVQLLANIAKRVARKSPMADQRLVETCIANSSITADQPRRQELVKLNHEMREIVMGRIAAICFDFAFYNNANSAFCFSMEQLCAVLAANAVSTGPKAIHHFLMEWIIPSRESMPPLSVVHVVLHVATEALRMEAPMGTRDMLQQLSQATMGLVAAPVLGQAVELLSAEQDNSIVLVACLATMERWFRATDLSLPQMKHLSHKVNIDIVLVLCNVLNSDSEQALDCLADFIEVALSSNNSSAMSPSRMTQARHLIHVDEAEFQQSISAKELNRIEQKEMAVILKQLVSACSLQRQRLVDQASRTGICRNLCRVAVAVSRALFANEDSQRTDEGLVDMLLKAGSHPMVRVCSMALMQLSKELLRHDESLCFRLLPVLQHRAIIPLDKIAETTGVELDGYESFRSFVLADALKACFCEKPDYYLDSCISAIEEFCNAPPSNDVGFQLEAALFCLVVVASEVLQLQDNSQDPNRNETNHDSRLERCMVALTRVSSEPILDNPLMCAQMCRFFEKYARWLSTKQDTRGLEVATQVALSTFNMASTATPSLNRALIQIMPTSPFSRAAKTLEVILVLCPQHFATIPAITKLGGAWEASYVASNQGRLVTVEDRKRLCRGICCVLASLPQDQRSKSFLALSLPTVDCLEKMTKFADDTRADEPQSLTKSALDNVDSVLARVADEVQVLSTMTRSFGEFCSNSAVQMGTGDAPDGQAMVKNPSLGVLKKTWPCITRLATTYFAHDRVSIALGELLSESVPRDVHDDDSFSLLKDLCGVATLVLSNAGEASTSTRPIFQFIEEVIRVHGNGVERTATSGNADDTSSHGRPEETSRLVESLLLSSTEAAKASLYAGRSSQGKEQGQGQQPYECKVESVPVNREPEKSTEVLSGLFSVLAVCVQKCPVFVAHLPATAGAADSDDDLLLVCSLEAAVAALTETQDEVSRSSMHFLKAAVDLYDSSVFDGGQNGIQSIRQTLAGLLSRTRRTIVMTILLNVCGLYAHMSLEPAALLLCSIMKTFEHRHEAESVLDAALRQDQFILGDDARSTTVQVLAKSTFGVAAQSIVPQILSDIWSLHQTSDVGSIAGGDAVNRYIQTYAD